MGTQCHIVGVGGRPDLTARARTRVEQLEARWSRFRPDSEISRINAAAGSRVVVSDDTFGLVTRALRAYRDTTGLFDPTVLSNLCRLGYDRTFTEVSPDGDPVVGEPAPGCEDIETDANLRWVSLPQGVGFDPGGIGKGLAADLVVSEMLAAGARGACVNIGGDLRVEGEAPTEDGWRLGIAAPHDVNQLIAVVDLVSGAMVTSTSMMRTWTRGGRKLHHLIDPRSGEPATSDLVAVTVLTREAWWGEVLAKVVFLLGSARGHGVFDVLGATGVTVDVNGTVTQHAGMRPFLVEPAVQ
jgi:thiamine biosynthesis lipoprotein